MDLFLIAIFLRKNAAAVFLHIESQVPCLLIAGTEIGAEVTIKEGDPILRRQPLCRFSDPVMILIRTAQKRRGKRLKAMLGCVFCRCLQPMLVAISAATINIRRHRLQLLRFP